MSRRTHACLSCPGRTRHADRTCATCRRLRPPTVAELERYGLDVSSYLDPIGERMGRVVLMPDPITYRGRGG